MNEKTIKTQNFIANENTRLDIALCAHLAGFSRASITQAIKNGLVLVNQKQIIKPAFKVQNGDIITFSYYDGIKAEISNENFNENFFANLTPAILYEDDDILVLDKPSGLVVHSAPSLKGEATLVEWLKHSGRELADILGQNRAGIVHRLDRGTSGAMVVAKNNFASRALSDQLANKTAGRLYLALCDLALRQNCVVDRALARCETNRLKKAIAKANQNGARPAKSAFANVYFDAENYSKTAVKNSKIKQNFQINQANLISAKLFSGRTHQIRVHLSSINRHILGDTLYGFKGSVDKMGEFFLHAYLLELIHPRTNKRMRFMAPLPKKFYEKLNIPKEIIDEKIEPDAICGLFDSCDEWLCYK